MINIGEIIDYMNTISDITDITGDRIYYGLPSEEPNDIYITVSVVSNIVISEAEQKTRIEFKIIAGDENGKFSDLQALSEILFNTFYNYDEDSIYKRVFKNNYQLYTSNLRKCFQRDIIFYQSY